MVEKSRCYDLICNETRDITKVKRKACVMRLVIMDGCESPEVIIDMSLTEGLDAEIISNHILAVLSRNALRQQSFRTSV